MPSPSQFLSRISIRLALFNLLVVFLPVAGVLFIGSYEQHLETAQVDSMQRQARLIVSTMQSGANATAVLRNVRFGEDRRNPFLAPYFVPSPFRVGFEVLVALREVAINCRFAGIHRLIVAVVDNGLGHSAEH